MWFVLAWLFNVVWPDWTLSGENDTLAALAVHRSGEGGRFKCRLFKGGVFNKCFDLILI